MASKLEPLQAMISTYATRLRAYNNALLTPVLPSTAPADPLSRKTKRGTTIINYAEDGYDDYDDTDDDRLRRPTGLRSLRRDESTHKLDPSERVGKETNEAVSTPGNWRDWMRQRVQRSDAQLYTQSSLPLTLIPIRIDVEIPAHALAAHLPITLPPTHFDPENPLLRPQELAVPYRLRDTFMWNLHEALMTTDMFAYALLQDLDLHGRQSTAAEISKQIRTQLEEYAGVALHPLFHAPVQASNPAEPPRKTTRLESATPTSNTAISQADTPMGSGGPSTPCRSVAAGRPDPIQTTDGVVAATASLAAPEADDDSPDDTYRCIVQLNITLGSRVYTDKFEWSLLHPPGTAEAFARVTCADLGLHGEWVSAMTHAIYEAVLRLKKEACEAGGLVTGWTFGSGGSGNEFPNDAAPSAKGEGAGWRYEPEHLADEWEPKMETLSKEEIEKREGDRERQLRRLRRETARFSSNAGMAGGVPVGFAPDGLMQQDEGERMGRGERSKKKRRFRSLSPLRSSTPGGRATPDVAVAAQGAYGGGGTLTEQERVVWRCFHCRVWGTSVWACRDGPHGPRTLCHSCGYVYERDRKLPRWLKSLHSNDVRPF